MKLWTSITILLFLSPYSVISVPGSAEGDDLDLLAGERPAEDNQTRNDDAQQVPLGPQSAQDAVHRIIIPEGDDAGDIPVREDEDPKTMQAHPPGSQVDVDVESSSGPDIPPQRTEEYTAQEEDFSRAQQIHRTNQAEESKDDDSGKEEEAVVELQGETEVAAALPPEPTAEQNQLENEALKKSVASESTATKGELNDDETQTAETRDRESVDGQSTHPPKARTSDADVKKSEAADGDQTETLNQLGPDEDSEKVTPRAGSEKESEAGQSTSEGSTENTLSATGHDEPHPQEVNETTITAASASEVEEETSEGSRIETLPTDTTNVAPTEVTYSHPVCGVWGRWQTQPRADLKLLYRLFEDVELGEPRRSEIPDPKEWASRITEDAIKQSTRSRRTTRDATSPPTTDADPEDRISNDTGTAKSANSEFVDGLDDIDKFFEEIDPPDELDVGAVGTSLQEVLMGQGTQIILKRLKMGLDFARKTFLAAKDKLAERFIDEDGNLTVFDQEKVEAVSAWVWKSSKRLYHEARVLLDNIIERGIAGGLSREYEEDEASSQTPPGSNDDVRELLRQYSRVGGGAPPKKYA